MGKLRTEFTSPMRKSTSPGLSDTTCFARWSDLKLSCMYQLLFALNIFKTAFFNNTVGTRNFENKFLKNLLSFVLSKLFSDTFYKNFLAMSCILCNPRKAIFSNIYISVQLTGLSKLFKGAILIYAKV